MEQSKNERGWMSRWWRSYADTHRNPKIAKLSDRDFRLWHNLLCIASENDGIIPPAEDLKHMLRMRLDHTYGLLNRLIDGALIDPLDQGYAPRNWTERQYKSDTSTSRVQKYRAKGNVSRNVSETAPDTETDTETEDSVAKATGGKPPDPMKELFDVGVSLLTSAGCTEQRARSLIGKWRQQAGPGNEGRVLAAFLECRGKAISNPMEWLTKRLQGAKYVSKSGYEYRGDVEQVIREAERRNDMDIYWKAKGDLKRQAA